jgi:CsoR family transcriptional regulator, copper-sensing transcriptional repressor
MAHARTDLLDRLARIEGQVRGIARMVEDERDCIDVLTQVSAARGALDEVALGLLDGHVEHCLADRKRDPGELMAAVARLVRAR